MADKSTQFPESQELNFNDALIQSTMLKSMDSFAIIRKMIKNLILHPFTMQKISDFQPNVYFGYTDHPLDVHGIAPNSAYAFIRNTGGRSSCSMLAVDLNKRQGNSFMFRARGYDVFKVRDMDTMFQHRYLVDEKTKHEPCTLRIDFLRADSYRLRFSRGEAVPDNNTPMVCGDISDADLPVDFVERDDRYIITTAKLRLELFRRDCRIEVRDASGALITESGGQTKNQFPTPMDCFPLGFVKDKKSGLQFGVESFVLYPGEAVYGLGEHFGPVNKVGKTIGMWNYEGLGNTTGRVYKNIPFFMSTQGYGVFVNESRPITFWVGSRETCKNMFAAEGDLIDYYFFYGPSFKEILGSYTALTGRPAVPPKWSFGTWISRISYYSQSQVMGVAKRLREMKFPADVIHIDTGWFDEDWRCDWKFNAERFPDPARMFKEAKDMGFRICLWQIPYALKDTKIFNDAVKKKALAKNNGPFIWLWIFEGSPIDFSRPEGIEWYKERIRILYRMGAATIKTDFGEQIEPYSRFAQYDGRAMHNLFPLLYHKAAFEVSQEVHGEHQAVLWSRSAYAGDQRYPVHWSGDNSSNHENLLSCLRGGLSLGLSGFTFWSQDAGGFVGIPDEDVYIRWTQVSIFQSHFRYHGNPPHYKEPWNFKPQTQDIVREYLNLRYRLIPYLYTESIDAANNGLPLLRHLAIEFQDDPTTHHIEDQFMCGRSLLIAPMLTAGRDRRIYLPAGTWYDYWSGEKLDGGRWIRREADIKTIPVYVRAGCIIPLAKAVQSTEELGYDDMTFCIFPDAADTARGEIVDATVRMSFSARVDGDHVGFTIAPRERAGIIVLLPGGISAKGLSINNKMA